MSDDITTTIESPEQKLKKLEDMSIQDIKDALILAVRRKARAEEDKAYYNKSYNEVIKEEKEVIAELMGRLETLMETNRLEAAKANWLGKRELNDIVQDERDALEQGDNTRVAKSRGFLRVLPDGTEFDGETGEVLSEAAAIAASKNN